MPVGETVKIELSFPETYAPNPDLAGVPATFDVTINYVLEFDKSGKRLTLRFGIGENKLCNFSLGDRAVADKMGFREEGEYDCAVSGAWVEKRRFSVMAQVIDTYFGGLYITLGFKDDRATFVMKNSGQYVFCGATGYAIGKKQQKAD